MLLQESGLAFRAMGTDCEVVVHAPDVVASRMCDLARQRIELLEQAWSRFRPSSGLSRLNAAAGRGPMPVSEDLLLLVERMQQAWRTTGGLFDPTVLASMCALGYDADLASVRVRPAADWSDVVLARAPGMSAVVIDRQAQTVGLPEGLGLDPGAIGKGLAADLVAQELADAGAEAVLVNLGGDIAVRGLPHDESAWTIAVADERDASPVGILTTVSLGPVAQGIATSTTLKRRWAQGRRHHVVDPRTGDMATSDLVQVTVIGPSACTAEVLATAALCRPAREAADWLTDEGVRALLLTPDAVIRVGGENHG